MNTVKFKVRHEAKNNYNLLTEIKNSTPEEHQDILNIIVSYLTIAKLTNLKCNIGQTSIEKYICFSSEYKTIDFTFSTFQGSFDIYVKVYRILKKEIYNELIDQYNLCAFSKDLFMQQTTNYLNKLLKI